MGNETLILWGVLLGHLGRFHVKCLDSYALFPKALNNMINFASLLCSFVDYGVMLEINDLQYLPDGRSFLDCVGGRRFKVTYKITCDNLIFFCSCSKLLQTTRTDPFNQFIDC